MLLKDRLVFRATDGSLVVSPDRVNPTRRQATRCSMIFTYHVAKLSICRALTPELRQNVQWWRTSASTIDTEPGCT